MRFSLALKKLSGPGADSFAKSLGIEWVQNSFFTTKRRLNQLRKRREKRYGRGGDSPIIGAGMYADNRSCAVSATGHGEYFIRHHVAADICAKVRYLNTGIEPAARRVIMEELRTVGASGGVIVLDRTGKIASVFNTKGMYRAMIDPDGTLSVNIYQDRQAN